MPKHVQNKRKIPQKAGDSQVKKSILEYETLLAREIEDDMCYFPKEIAFAYPKETAEGSKTLQDTLYYVASQCLDEYEAYKMVDRWLWQPGAFRGRAKALNMTPASEISKDDIIYMLVEINKKISRTVALQKKTIPGAMDAKITLPFMPDLKGPERLNLLAEMLRLTFESDGLKEDEALQIMILIGISMMPFAMHNLQTALAFMNLSLAYYGKAIICPFYDMNDKTTDMVTQLKKVIEDKTAYADRLRELMDSNEKTHVTALYNELAYNLVKEYLHYVKNEKRVSPLGLDVIIAQSISAPGEVGLITVTTSRDHLGRALDYIRKNKITCLFESTIEFLRLEVVGPLLKDSQCTNKIKIQVDRRDLDKLLSEATMIIVVELIYSNQDKRYGDLLYNTLSNTALICHLSKTWKDGMTKARVSIDASKIVTNDDYIALKSELKHQLNITQIEERSGIRVQRR